MSRLMLQFLEWVARRPRTYAETMDAWRTSCPRLSVWEDAGIAGFVEVIVRTPGQREVALTASGEAALSAEQTEESP